LVIGHGAWGMEKISHSHSPLPITHYPLRGSEVAHGGDHGRCFKSAKPPNALPPQDRAGSPLPITHYPLTITHYLFCDYEATGSASGFS
jgi:hypothetical protein